MILVAVACYGAGFGMFNSVLAPVWVPLGCAVAAAAALMFWTMGLWRRVTGVQNRVANIIVGMILSTGVLFAGVTGLNFVKMKGSEPVEVTAEVVKTYRTKHYRSRRVRRNVYVKGSPYWQHHVVVKLPDGREKKIDISTESYNHLRRYRSVPVHIRHGLLGMDIISLSE